MDSTGWCLGKKAFGPRKKKRRVRQWVFSCPFGVSRTSLDGPREVYEDVVWHIEEDANELAGDVLLALLGHVRGGRAPRGRKCGPLCAEYLKNPTHISSIQNAKSPNAKPQPARRRCRPLRGFRRSSQRSFLPETNQQRDPRRPPPPRGRSADRAYACSTHRVGRRLRNPGSLSRAHISVVASPESSTGCGTPRARSSVRPERFSFRSRFHRGRAL